jgi:hypothetical protein
MPRRETISTSVAKSSRRRQERSSDYDQQRLPRSPCSDNAKVVRPQAAPGRDWLTIDNPSRSLVSETRYPNESAEYRSARDKLLEEDRKLVEQTKAVAALRRELPRGGELKEDYTFTWATEDKLGQPVKLSELFGDRNTLLLYNFMFGPGWDNPCPSCTSLMDGFDRTTYQVTLHAAFAGIAKATHEMIHDWAQQRGWTQIPLVRIRHDLPSGLPMPG